MEETRIFESKTMQIKGQEPRLAAPRPDLWSKHTDDKGNQTLEDNGAEYQVRMNKDASREETIREVLQATACVLSQICTISVPMEECVPPPPTGEQVVITAQC
jgi:hypothetical protein